MCASEQTVLDAASYARARSRTVSPRAQTHRALQSHPDSPAPIAGNHRRPRSTFAVIAATHAHRQSPARVAARDRSAPHARRLRDGRARIRRRALYAGRAFEPRLFPDAKLHFTDHAGGHLVLARSRPGRKRRHVRHSARSRRRRLARACRSSRQRSRVAHGRRALPARVEARAGAGTRARPLCLCPARPNWRRPPAARASTWSKHASPGGS